MINIPHALQSRLTDTSDKALVNAAQTACESLVRGGMFFFPEYTDHSQEHISGVLASCAELIADTALPLLTSRDVAALICAVFLHDCSMYLREDQFFWILDNPEKWPALPGYGDESWRALYQKFETEASRFDGRKRLALFGASDATPALPQKPGNPTDHQKLLVGEFLRRHHPRLAHEIAVHGLPVLDGKPAPFLTVPDAAAGGEKLADVIGFIARSHGMNLRACVDRLYDRYRNTIVQQKVHSPFLMSLLRVGDYIQLQAERAPKTERRFRTFDSQTSREEWDKHKSISDVRIRGTQHPETIEVTAEPESAAEFLGVRGWLDGIQLEIDASWAVLGEVYGNNKDLAGLGTRGLSVRRVRSETMDDPLWAERQSYVPKHAQFAPVGASLLSLLVGPLYKYNPVIGVRELLANAVDSVRERQKLKRRSEMTIPDFDSSRPDVLITYHAPGSLKDAPDPERAYMTFVDQGTGMTEDIVLNYFLKAGASFRQSAAWKDQHEDASGRSNTLRAGRFGIGALAAFLLCNEGESITVTTRHYSAAKGIGITFTASIEKELIEIERIPREEVGTTITVPLSQRAIDIFEANKENLDFGDLSFRGTDESWDWFGMDDVSVVRRRGSTNETLKQGVRMPKEDIAQSLGWFRETLPRYQNVKVDCHLYSGGIDSVYCNGILIQADPSFDFLCTKGVYTFRVPTLFLSDPDAELEINLQRDSFEYSIDWLPASMGDSVVDQFVSNLYSNRQAVKSRSFWSSWIPVHSVYDTDGLESAYPYQKNEFHPLSLAKNGICLIDNRLWFENSIRRLFVVLLNVPEGFHGIPSLESSFSSNILSFLDTSDAAVLLTRKAGKTSLLSAEHIKTFVFDNPVLNDMPISAKRLVIKQRDISHQITTFNPDYVSERVIGRRSKCSILEWGECPETSDTIHQIANELYTELGSRRHFAVLEVFVDWPLEGPSKTRISEAWNQKYGRKLLPF